ncbi:T9SS type A sorting domain-containing protein [bacterium]
MKFRIQCGFPNPFNANVHVQYQTDQGRSQKDLPVRFRVYNLLGQKIYEETRKDASDGYFIWNGRNQRGVKQESGCYIVQMLSGEMHDSIKITLIQ